MIFKRRNTGLYTMILVICPMRCQIHIFPEWCYAPFYVCLCLYYNWRWCRNLLVAREENWCRLMSSSRHQQMPILSISMNLQTSASLTREPEVSVLVVGLVTGLRGRQTAVTWCVVVGVTRSFVGESLSVAVASFTGAALSSAKNVVEQWSNIYADKNTERFSARWQERRRQQQ